MSDLNTQPQYRMNADRPGGRPSWLGWVIAAIAAIVLAIVLFFAIGGDADVDVEPGSVDVDVDSGSVDGDVDAPDVDVEAPDIDVDPGSVDVDDAEAEADADG